jgi:hypothetical protein
VHHLIKLLKPLKSGVRSRKTWAHGSRTLPMATLSVPRFPRQRSVLSRFDVRLADRYREAQVLCARQRAGA